MPADPRLTHRAALRSRAAPGLLGHRWRDRDPAALRAALACDAATLDRLCLCATPRAGRLAEDTAAIAGACRVDARRLGTLLAEG